MKFDELRLIEPILRAVAAEGYTTPTPIQMKAIPHVLEGRDLLGCAQTGTGKTAAFALPILQRLMHANGRGPSGGQARGGSGGHNGRGRRIRVLVLAPTRELASQINESFCAYGRHSGLRSTVVYGGVSQHPQTRALQDGVDILVATPGRLMDLMQQGYVDLSGVEVFVLDEADNMLDMGFIHDIRKIAPKLPRQRQTLMFSATMPAEIRQLADSLLSRPVSVAVTPVASTVDTVEQSVYMVDKPFKPAMLTHYLNNNAVARMLVFARTKHGADKLARHLAREGIRAEAIHGNKSQNARNRVMSQFKSGSPPVLVATDIAARGLDIDDVSHVVNYDLPNVAEIYVHRIGRTARAGASGVAVSFCDCEERGLLRDIERLIRKSISIRSDQPRFTAKDLPARPPRVDHSNRDAGPHRRDGGRGRRPRPAGELQTALAKAISAGEAHARRAGGLGQDSAVAVTEAPRGVGYRSRGRRMGRGRLSRR
jgi:ATP-dependent RNA helicase RhlE